MTATRIHPDLIEDLLKRRGEANLKMYGTSMSPLLPEGKMVKVSAQDLNTIRIGDVVCFRTNSHLIAHRVVHLHAGKEGLYILPKGDNSNCFDRPVRKEEIIGRVIGIENRSVTSPAWRLFNFMIAKLSYFQGRFPEWRHQSAIYRTLSRLKKTLGLKKSWYPFLKQALNLCFGKIRALLNHLC